MKLTTTITIVDGVHHAAVSVDARDPFTDLERAALSSQGRVPIDSGGLVSGPSSMNFLGAGEVLGVFSPVGMPDDNGRRTYALNGIAGADSTVTYTGGAWVCVLDSVTRAAGASADLEPWDAAWPQGYSAEEVAATFRLDHTVVEFPPDRTTIRAAFDSDDDPSSMLPAYLKAPAWIEHVITAGLAAFGALLARQRGATGSSVRTFSADAEGNYTEQ